MHMTWSINQTVHAQAIPGGRESFEEALRLVKPLVSTRQVGQKVVFERRKIAKFGGEQHLLCMGTSGGYYTWTEKGLIGNIGTVPPLEG